MAPSSHHITSHNTATHILATLSLPFPRPSYLTSSPLNRPKLPSVSRSRNKIGLPPAAVTAKGLTSGTSRQFYSSKHSRVGRSPFLSPSNTRNPTDRTRLRPIEFQCYRDTYSFAAAHSRRFTRQDKAESRAAHYK